MRIRDAVEADWPSISNISRRSGYEDYINNSWGPSYLEDGRVMIAEDTEALGFARIDMLPDGAAWFSGLRVDPDHWRKGVGTEITKRLVQESKSMGANAIRMTVESANFRSRKLVEKMEFTNIGNYFYFDGTANLTGYEETEISEDHYVSLRWRFVRSGVSENIPGKFYSKGKNVIFVNEENNSSCVINASEKIEYGGGGMTVWKQDNFAPDLCGLQLMEHFPSAVLYEMLL